jgi:hypothetical protein
MRPSFLKLLIIICAGFALLGAKSVIASVSIESYCSNGWYQNPSEPQYDSCSRAPYCGGVQYQELCTDDQLPDAQRCVGDDQACQGYVPYCCYEMARTGDYSKCIGYWERLWCAPVQCAEAKANGAKNSQCPEEACNCAHAFKYYCGDRPVIPVETRFGLPYQPPSPTSPPAQPSTTPPSTPPQITNSPSQPIPTPANQPGINHPFEVTYPTASPQKSSGSFTDAYFYTQNQIAKGSYNQSPLPQKSNNLLPSSDLVNNPNSNVFADLLKDAQNSSKLPQITLKLPNIQTLKNEIFFSLLPQLLKTQKLLALPKIMFNYVYNLDNRLNTVLSGSLHSLINNMSSP